MKIATSSTVTSPYPSAAVPDRPEPEPSSGRSFTIVSIVPDTASTRLPGHELGHVDDVRADVAQRPRTRVLLLQAPCERHRRVDEPVLPVRRAHLLNRAHDTLGDEVPQEGHRGHAAVGEADHRAHSALGGAGGGIRHRLGLFDRVGERLLAQHVLAGLERGDRDLGVRVARRDDVDDVDVIPSDHLAPVGGRFRPAPLLGCRGHGIRIPAHDHGHLDGLRQVEHARRLTPPDGVGGAHEAVADHGDAQRPRRARLMPARPRARPGRGW